MMRFSVMSPILLIGCDHGFALAEFPYVCHLIMIVNDQIMVYYFNVNKLNVFLHVSIHIG